MNNELSKKFNELISQHEKTNDMKVSGCETALMEEAFQWGVQEAHDQIRKSLQNVQNLF